MESPKQIESPIKSGWRGNLSGAIDHAAGSSIEVSQITLRLDRETAYALANLLTDDAMRRSCAVNTQQVVALSSVGAALGRLVDHHAANNGGRDLVR